MFPTVPGGLKVVMGARIKRSLRAAFIACEICRTLLILELAMQAFFAIFCSIAMLQT